MKVTAMGCVPVGWRRYPMVVVELVEIEEWTVPLHNFLGRSC